MTRKQFLNHSTTMAVFSCMLWSTAFVAIKIGLQYYPPIRLAGIRFFLAGLVILPFISNIREQFALLIYDYKKMLYIGLFQTFGLYSLFHLGISMVPASITAIIIGGGPLFIAIMSRIIMQEKLTLQKMSAIFIGLSGIILIAVSRFDTTLKGGAVFYGILILIASNLSGSLGNILVAKSQIKISPVFLTSMQFLTGGTGIFILSCFVEDATFVVRDIEFYLALFYLAAMAALAFSVWFIVLKRPGIQVSEINIWKFLIPVFGAVLSWTMLKNEHPDLYSLLGMILIAVALVIMHLNIKKFFSHR